MTYEEFLEDKRQSDRNYGFDYGDINPNCHPFQGALVEWATKKGRAAIFADCGLGKTLMQLNWADNVYKQTGGRVLVLTPLAVSHQTVNEGRKFGIDTDRSLNGKLNGAPIIVTNYERLHYFNHSDFRGIVCDESSILKNFEGAIKSAITDFSRKIPYRLLCTATAAPNDFIELGTSSEALGELGFMDMISRFFKKIDATYSRKHETMSGVYRLRPYAQRDFWRWICSWSRSIRRPSDLGFDDSGFILPKLITRQHIVTAREKNPEFLFDLPAVGLKEQRQERSRTVTERCEMAAELVSHKSPAIAWCHLIREGDLLEKLIPDSVQVSGRDSDEAKEEKFKAFEDGQIRVMVTKPKIAGFGLNWQHCAHQTFFPSHSFEQFYQGVRRSWRFGQTEDVTIDVISTEGEQRVLKNLQKKSEKADQMFSELVSAMKNELKITRENKLRNTTKKPQWL